MLEEEDEEKEEEEEVEEMARGDGWSTRRSTRRSKRRSKRRSRGCRWRRLLEERGGGRGGVWRSGYEVVDGRHNDPDFHVINFKGCSVRQPS